MEVLEWLAEYPDLNPMEACQRDIVTELEKVCGRVSDVEALETMLCITWRYYRGAINI